MADTASPPPRPRPPSDDLLTPDQRAALLANGRRSASGADIDPHPVVKLFTPDANATWLLSELDPGEPDRAFGLCDLGLGSPELGYVSMAELRALRGQLSLPVEVDQGFVADRPLSSYADVARDRGRIPAALFVGSWSKWHVDKNTRVRRIGRMVLWGGRRRR